jgi:hypothetical protein
VKAVVISQPMFFPWVGMFEQLRLADAYVHYDDVQFSKGSFTSRVQIKTADGSRWLSVPLRGLKLGQRIMEVAVDNGQDWRQRHLALLSQAYGKAPFHVEMLALVKEVYRLPAETICELAIASMQAIRAYFQLPEPKEIYCSSKLGVPAAGSQRVLDVVKKLGGTIYVTGHGASNYLDHALFEQQGVRVEYLDYRKAPYPQLHGPFTPFVSALDLIANCGTEGRDVIASGTIYWKDFIK